MVVQRSKRPNPFRNRVLFLLTTIILWVSVASTGEIDTDVDGCTSDDEVIGYNPDYAGPPSTDEDRETDYDDDNDGSSYEDSEEIEEDEEDEEKDEKSALANALSKSREKTSRSVKFLRKHRTAVTVSLIFFAFRREIWSLLSSLLVERYGSKNGDKKAQRVSFSLTSILKIILFIDVMRKIMQSSDDSHPSPFPMSALIGGPGGIVGAFLMELIHPANPAFVPPVEQHYTFERINERYTKDRLAFQKALSPSTSNSIKILRRKVPRNDLDSKMDGKVTDAVMKHAGDAEYNSTVIIMDLTGLDTSVSQIDVLRDEVSFLLSQHRENVVENKHQSSSTNQSTIETSNISIKQTELEIVLLLESPGGSASDYGLAANQVGRLRDEPGIQVTICVDKVAASGGYMMACQSSPGKLYAAPFAVLGSIGVIGQALNIHNALQNWGVKPLVFRGGKDKAPVGMIGEVTKEGMAKVQSMVDKTHNAFKRHVLKARPEMAEHINSVATGDVWLGCDAKDVGLIDRIVTSDEYIGERIQQGARVLKLIRYSRRFSFIPSQSRRQQFMESRMSSGSRMWYDIKHIVSKVAESIDCSSSEVGSFSGMDATTRSGGIRMESPYALGKS